MRQELRSLTSSSTPRWCRRGSLGEDLWAPGKWSLGQKSKLFIVVNKVGNRTVSSLKNYITFESPRWAHTTIISGYLVNRVSQIWKKRIIIYSWSLSLCLSFITFRCWIFLKFFFGVLVASKKPLNDDINVWEVGTNDIGTFIFSSSCLSNPICDRAKRGDDDENL